MKVAIIYSFEESNWFSCTIINKNLRLAYEAEFGKENIVEINYSKKGNVSVSDLNKIIEENIEKLVFIDHMPTPLFFLNRLKSVEGELSTQREYIIHVFGDFPLYLGEWKLVHEELKGHTVKYICASEKQKKLIEKFIPQKNLVFVSPFPVDSEKFNFEHKTITPFEKWGVSPSDKIVLYTGRISLQKRIKEALVIFFECLKEKSIPVNSKFLIVGEFDLLGSVYLGYSQLQGEYFRDIDKVIAKYSEFKEHVIFCGQVENDVLKDFYKSADLYLSLSTYHDEDFGMSVAEALMSGLPAILSNWAGYSSFNLSNEFVKLVNVKLGSQEPTLELAFAKESLVEMLNKDFDRSKLALLAKEYLDIKACGKTIRRTLNEVVDPFEGASDLMIRLTSEQGVRGLEFFRSETNREFNSFYFKVYDVYTE